MKNLTVPYWAMGVKGERPNEKPRLDAHLRMGELLKRLVAEESCPGYLSWTPPAGFVRPLNSLRSTLEDWMGCETILTRRSDVDYICVYYQRPLDSRLLPKPPAGCPEGTEDAKRLLEELDKLLKKSYPDCKPLRWATGRVATARRSLEWMEWRENKKARF